MNLIEEIQNGAPDYGKKIARTPALRRRNRIVVAVLVVIALSLFIAAFFYIKYYGGINKGPMKPLHSGRVVPPGGTGI